MSTEFGKRTTIFVHIPKTAGTTLKQMMQYNLSPRRCFEFYHLPNRARKKIEQFQRLPASRKQEIEFISGHIGFGLHESIDRPCTHITVLRQPVKRAISYYTYLLGKDHPATRDRSLRSFVETHKASQNGMVKYISGLRFHNQRYDLENCEIAESCSVETLERAKQNLQDHFQVFGLMERFNESLVLFGEELNWKIPSFAFKRNVLKNHSQRAVPDAETLRAIEQANQYDLQFYEFACQLFAQRIARQDSSFARKLCELERSSESSLQKAYFSTILTFKRVLYTVHRQSFGRA